MDKHIRKEKRGGGLLPIINPLDVKSTQEDLRGFMLRLTPMGKYTRDDVIVFLESITQNYLISTEESKKKKEHYHACIIGDFEEEEIRNMIRLFLLRYFTEPAKRGDANKQYNLTEVEDVEQSITYILKENNYVYGKNINPEYVNKCQKSSYLKYDKRVFSEKLEEIKKMYKVGTIVSLRDFMVAVVKLKAEYRQPINMNYIYQLSVSCKVHNDPEYAYTLVEDYLQNKNL